MTDSQVFEELLVQQLPFVRRVAAKLCLRHGLGNDDVDDFVSYATAKLVDNDYGILRKFQGNSLITTFLTVVIRRLYGDFQNAEKGRWRPSAEARRQGDDAVELEELVYRDGYSLQAAIEKMRERGTTQRTERELNELFGLLPNRHRGRFKKVGDDTWLASAPSSDTADAGVVARESRQEWSMIKQALARSIERLDAEDAVFLRMLYFEGLSIASAARALGLEQKPLYRRRDGILEQLKGFLAEEGIPPERFAELFGESKNDS